MTACAVTRLPLKMAARPVSTSVAAMNRRGAFSRAMRSKSMESVISSRRGL